MLMAASKSSAHQGAWIATEAERTVLISVVIPTVERRELLVRAVQSVCQQRLRSGSAEIIVIDNSPDGRQRQIVESVVQPSDSRITVRCVHEPKRGLVFARNRGVAEAKGDFVVFLDDDEYPADPDWLTNLVDAAAQSGVDAAFGPVVPEFEVEPARISAFIMSVYSRDTRRADHTDVTDLTTDLGTGNSCFRRQTCFDSLGKPFTYEFNSTGGEDVDFLFRLRRGGKRFAWAATAAVYEFVSRERLSPTYLSDRRFRQGQQHAYLQISSHPRRYDALFFWMAVGVLQTVYHFTAKWIARLCGMDECADLHGIQIWGGLGKILWQAKHRRSHYGPQESI